MNFKRLQHVFIITVLFAVMAAGSTNAAGRGPAAIATLTMGSQPTQQATGAASATDGRVPLTADNVSYIHNVMTLPAESVKAERFSPDGSLLAYADHDKVEVWDARTFTHRATLTYATELSVQVKDMRFSPDGSRLFLAMDKAVAIWDIQTGQLITRTALPVPQNDSCFVRLSVDATLIVLTCYNDTNVQIVDVQTGEAKALLKPDQGDQPNIAFSPDGTLLATGGPRGKTKLWNIPSGQLYAEIDTSTYGKGDVTTLQFTPDGSLLLIITGNSMSAFWDVHSEQFGQTFDPVRDWTFNRDGTLAVYCTKSGFKTTVVNPRTGETRFSGGFEGGCHNEAVISPDNSLVIATSVGQEMKVWDMKTGVEKAAFTDFAQQQLDFSPDGTLLLTISPSTGSPKVQLWGLSRAAAPNATLYGVQYTTAKGSGVSASIPSSWLSPTPRYDIKFTDVEQTVGTCSYLRNHTLLLKGIDVTVTITDLKTKRQVARQSFKGVYRDNYWKHCPNAWQFSSLTAETIVKTPDSNAVTSWIKTTMARFGLK